MERIPAVRASAIRDSLAYLDKFQPGTQARVLEQVPGATLELLENAPRSAWVPLEHDHHFVDAIIAVLGRPRAIEYWAASFADLVDRPLLRNFVSGMVLALGRKPATVVTFFVKGWGLAFRDACEPQFVTAIDGDPAIRFEKVDPVVRRYSNYMACWEGTCRGFAHIAKVRGRVDFRTAADLSWAEARFSWAEERV